MNIMKFLLPILLVGNLYAGSCLDKSIKDSVLINDSKNKEITILPNCKENGVIFSKYTYNDKFGDSTVITYNFEGNVKYYQIDELLLKFISSTNFIVASNTIQNNKNIYFYFKHDGIDYSKKFLLFNGYLLTQNQIN